jgi:hypothetical protein
MKVNANPYKMAILSEYSRYYNDRVDITMRGLFAEPHIGVLPSSYPVSKSAANDRKRIHLVSQIALNPSQSQKDVPILV